MLVKWICLSVLLFLQACVYTQSVTLTNVPLNRSQKVSASVERWVFFATFDSNEVNSAPEALKKKCPGGRITGVSAKELRRLFLFQIIMKREIHLEGYCQANSNAEQVHSDTEKLAEISL